MEYENEDPAAIQDGIEDTTVGIFLIRQNGGSEVEDILVVLEGQAVLVDLPSVGLHITSHLGVSFPGHQGLSSVHARKDVEEEEEEEEEEQKEKFNPHHHHHHLRKERRRKISDAECV
ncbi:hypothetical protein JOB18_007981 [Solea senegalensis]|nr:hypothetical protein JOB18_007981 [Solea senegalensis]